MFPWLPYLDARSGEDMADHYIEIPRFTGRSATADGRALLGVNDADTVIVGIIHLTGIAVGGGIKSIHKMDDSTSYQNTSGQTAYAIIAIVAGVTGTADKLFKIYSSPNNDSKTSATEIFSFDMVSGLDAVNEQFTTPVLPIQNNHYLVIENNTVAANNVISVNQRTCSIVERG